MIIPTLHTPDLIVRPILSTDAPAMLNYASDPCVAFYRQWTAHTCIEDSAAFIQHHRDHGLLWAIIDKTSNSMIGDCGLTNITPTTAEIHYTLTPEHWGKGFATQAATVVQDFCFEQLVVQELQAWIITTHTRSLRVAHKLGMEPVLTLANQWCIEDRLYDLAMYRTINKRGAYKTL